MLEGIKERPRPRLLYGITECVKTHSGNMYITLNVDDDLRPFEIFLRIGRSDPVEQAHLEGLARVVSYCLRLGGDPHSIMGNLEGITSEPIWSDGVLIRSAEDGLGKVFRKFLAGEYDDQLISMRAVDGVQLASYQRRLPVNPVEEDDALAVESADKRSAVPWVICPQCNGRAMPVEGCLQCIDCDYEKCS